LRIADPTIAAPGPTSGRAWRSGNPEIYLKATRALRVEPEMAVFIGDGGDNELAGAERLAFVRSALTGLCGVDSRLDCPTVVELGWRILTTC